MNQRKKALNSGCPDGIVTHHQSGDKANSFQGQNPSPSIKSAMEELISICTPAHKIAHLYKKGAKIVVLDDNENNIFLLKTALGRNHISLSNSFLDSIDINTSNAILSILRGKNVVLILDFDMPGIDGQEFLVELLEMAVNKNLAHILFVVGFSGNEENNKLIEAICDKECYPRAFYIGSLADKGANFSLGTP